MRWYPLWNYYTIILHVFSFLRGKTPPEEKKASFFTDVNEINFANIITNKLSNDVIVVLIGIKIKLS